MRWEELEGVQEGKVVEVMAEMRGRMSGKKKAKKGRLSEDENPWLTPEETEQSEPERVGTGNNSVDEAAVKETQETVDKAAVKAAVKEIQETLEQLVEKEEGRGGLLDWFVEDVAVMGELQREEVMRMYQASVPVEFGQWGIEVGTASLRRMVAKRVEQNERKRKTSDGVSNFGKYEGQTFAAVYLKDESYAEWAVKQDKCRMWKLKCFKLFLKRLSDLERVMKREREPEEKTRAECLAEEMVQEDMKVVEEHRVRLADVDGGSERVRWADMGEDSEEECPVAAEEQREQND